MSVNTVGDKLLLGVNTTIIAMGIVFIVLILLAILIVLQSKILKTLSSMKERNEAKPGKVYENVQKVSEREEVKHAEEITKGETVLIGIEEEEHIAAIMAAVSAAANIPVSVLKIRSIKQIDNA